MRVILLHVDYLFSVQGTCNERITFYIILQDYIFQTNLKLVMTNEQFDARRRYFIVV